LSGTSVSATTAAAVQHARRQPPLAISVCSHGIMTIEPTPTPENAMPMARPRRRTNQLGRNTAWPV
jgi:hypothetical protein